LTERAPNALTRRLHTDLLQCGMTLAGSNNPRVTVTLKCDPELARDLRAANTGIAAGYQMNREHWNTVNCTAERANGDYVPGTLPFFAPSEHPTSRRCGRRGARPSSRLRHAGRDSRRIAPARDRVRYPGRGGEDRSVRAASNDPPDQNPQQSRRAREHGTHPLSKYVGGARKNASFA
jgi:hypothetical protein